MKSKYHILFEYEKINPTVQKTIDFFKLVCAECGYISIFKSSYKISKQDLKKVDMLFSIRPCSNMSVYLAKRAKACNIKYAVNYDDDLVELYRSQNIKYRLKATVQCIQYADVVSVCNPIIYEKYKKINSNILMCLTSAICNNVCKNFDVKVKEKIKIVYPTTQDHIQEWSMISKAFYSLPDEVKKKIELNFIGIVPEITKENSGIDVVQYSHMSFEEYDKFMSNNQFVIGLAPLGNTDFNNCKYYNKYLEYTKYGIVGIYSDIPLYKSVISDGFNGFLAENTAECWKKTIAEMISNPDKLKYCLLHAQDEINHRYTIKYNADIFGKFIEGLLEKSESSVFLISIIKLKFAGYFFKIYDLLYKSCNVLKHEGLNSLLKRVKLNIFK